jgi:hypothetical protein
VAQQREQCNISTESICAGKGENQKFWFFSFAGAAPP